MLTIIEEMEVLFITDDDELGGWVGCFGCGPTAGVALEGWACFLWVLVVLGEVPTRETCFTHWKVKSAKARLLFLYVF